MKEKLKKFCRNKNIEKVGIAPIGPYKDLEKLLRKKINLGHYTGFEEKDLKKRIDPKLTMQNVQSIIVCLFPYLTDHRQNGNLSKYTYSVDYHLILKERLDEIGRYLETQIEDFQYKAFVDTGPLVDRYMAYLAGLGFWGINSHIITEEYGSYVFIGYMMTNYPFPIDKPMDKTCIQCFSCVENCPGSIILGNFTIDPRKCRSFLTQKKEELLEDEEIIVGKTDLVFGCDVCQDVCPHNKKIEASRLKEFNEDLIFSLSRKEIDNMSNKEFKAKYGDRAFAWRGKKIILRNFDIIKGERLS